MTASLHENLSRSEEVKGSSDRGFGLTVGGILVVLAGVRGWRHDAFGTVEMVLAGIGVCLFVMGLIAPARLAFLNRAWTKLGLIMFKVVNPVVLALMYVVTIVPIGLIMRVCGRDPLLLRLDPSASTYWVRRDPPGPAPESMTHQF